MTMLDPAYMGIAFVVNPKQLVLLEVGTNLVEESHIPVMRQNLVTGQAIVRYVQLRSSLKLVLTRL